MRVKDILYFILFLVVSTTYAQVGQILEFPAFPSLTCTSSGYNLNASASSGLPVTYRVLIGKAYIENNLLLITGPGTIRIEAFQEGNSIFLPSDTVVRSTYIPEPYPQNVDLSVSYLSRACENESLTMGGINVNGLNYLWTKPDASTITGSFVRFPSVVQKDSGIYKVKLFWGNCTFFENSFKVSVFKNPPVPIFQWPDSIFKSDPPFPIPVTPQNGQFLTGQGVAGNMYTPANVQGQKDSLVYKFIDTNGCSTTTSQTLRVYEKKQPKAPNDSTVTVYEFISANGDELNKFWTITNIEKFKHEITLTNVWGIQVLHSTNYQNDWSGENWPVGVYFYTVKLKDLGKEIQGELLLTR